MRGDPPLRGREDPQVLPGVSQTEEAPPPKPPDTEENQEFSLAILSALKSSGQNCEAEAPRLLLYVTSKGGKALGLHLKPREGRRVGPRPFMGPTGESLVGPEDPTTPGHGRSHTAGGTGYPCQGW